MVDFLSFFYFLIFIGNAFFYSYFSFKSIKSNIDLFRDVHKNYKNPKYIESKIAALPYKLLIENTLICVYMADILENFEYKILILRIFFVFGGLMGDRLEVGKRVILERLLHNLILSFMVIPNFPTYSYLIHLLDNFGVIIFDKYFHDYYDAKKDFLRSDSFMSKLDKFIAEEEKNK